MRRRNLSVPLVALWILLYPLSATPQTDARAVLERVIEALGGPSYLAAENVRMRGRFYQFQRGQLVGGDVFIDTIQWPDKERTEFGNDREIVRINNGEQGWNISDDGIEEQIPEQIDLFWEEFKVSLDYVLRYVVNDPDTTVQYLGREMIDFKRADILEVRDSDRTRITLYVERESGVPMKKAVRRIDDPAVHEEVYSNYHVLQNIRTPLLIDRYTDGAKSMQIRFEEVTYNNPLSEGLFTAAAGR